MSLGAYEKENGSGSYQIKTRQYSNLCLQIQTPKYVQKGVEQKMSPHQENKPSQRPYRQESSEYSEGRFERQAKYSPLASLDNYDRAERLYQQREQMGRFCQHSPKLEEDRFNEHSFGESDQTVASINTQNKRENARKKGLEMKINNIESISDKIYSLLSMVKKDRADRSPKEPHDRGQRSPSPSPLPFRETMANLGGRECRTPVKSNYRQDDLDSYSKDNSKSNQRLRTLSALEPNLPSKKKGKPELKLDAKLISNEEDEYQHLTTYSPAKGNNQGAGREGKAGRRGGYNYEKIAYEQSLAENEEKSYSRNTDGQSYGQLYANKNQLRSNQKATPSKSDFQSDFNKPSPSMLGRKQKLDKTPPGRYGQQDGFLPITLVQERQKREGYSPAGMRVVDNQLKRIKEKIEESEGQKRKYQQRIQSREAKNQVPVGRIYSKDLPLAQNKFEIKVYPVYNDREQTVKIAEKLCFQIELDNRMRRGRMELGTTPTDEQWRDLQSKIGKYGVRMMRNQLSFLLCLSPEEFDPFENQQGSARKTELAQLFSEAHKYWQKQVYGCANAKSLKGEGFSNGQLDHNNKGYISIEDIVCFVNLYTGHFYKNRDLAIIFRRLQLLEGDHNRPGIEHSTFLRAFTM